MSEPLTVEQLNERIEALLRANDFGLDAWSTSTDPAVSFTYQFESKPQEDFGLSNVTGVTNFTNQQPAIRKALAEVASIINVTFLEITGSADPDFSFYSAANLRTAEVAGVALWSFSGDAWDASIAFRSDIDLASAYDLVLHETGHSLGLKHPGDYDAAGNAASGPFLPVDEENNKFSVMSYNAHPISTVSVGHLMLYDIAALQKFWGANMATRTGNDTYSGPDDGQIQAIWDAGGNDTMQFVGSTSGVLDLRAGTFSSLGAIDNLAIAYGVTIENAVGGDGADRITGNEVANILRGGDGADTIAANGGNDTIAGGAGADSMTGGDGFDVASYADAAAAVAVSLAAGTGSAGEANGDSLVGIESLIGSDHGDELHGNSDHNIIEGRGGADVIFGDAGNDWVSYEHATSAIAVNLAVSVDSGYLGQAIGDDVSGVENILGSAFGDFLYGDTGANILRGGAGSDVLYGGGNSDTIDYSDNTVGVTVDLSANSALGGLAQGDTLVSVENVVATPYSDILIGDSASNTLYGWFGIDWLTGNGSNDIFAWRSLSDSGVLAGQRDTVSDFWRSHGDLLDLSGIDADGSSGNGDQAFAFIGTAAFSAAGQIRYRFEGSSTVVEINTDSSMAADMAVQLSNGNLALAATDFVL